jgi:hypothetical protein
MIAARGFLREEDGRRDGFFFRPPTFLVSDIFLAFAIKYSNLISAAQEQESLSSGHIPL